MTESRFSKVAGRAGLSLLGPFLPGARHALAEAIALEEATAKLGAVVGRNGMSDALAEVETFMALPCIVDDYDWMLKFVRTPTRLEALDAVLERACFGEPFGAQA